jgi:hypothetical protein
VCYRRASSQLFGPAVASCLQGQKDRKPGRVPPSGRHGLNLPKELLEEPMPSEALPEGFNIFCKPRQKLDQKGGIPNTSGTFQVLTASRDVQNIILLLH